MRAKVTRTSIHLPPHVETAFDLAERVERSAHWIDARTGVAERRVSSLQMDQMAALAHFHTRVTFLQCSHPD